MEYVGIAVMTALIKIYFLTLLRSFERHPRTLFEILTFKNISASDFDLPHIEEILKYLPGSLAEFIQKIATTYNEFCSSESAPQ